MILTEAARTTRGVTVTANSRMKVPIVCLPAAFVLVELNVLTESVPKNNSRLKILIYLEISTTLVATHLTNN
jgi:hypothetical protein